MGVHCTGIFMIALKRKKKKQLHKKLTWGCQVCGISLVIKAKCFEYLEIWAGTDMEIDTSHTYIDIWL